MYPIDLHFLFFKGFKRGKIKLGFRRWYISGLENNKILFFKLIHSLTNSYEG